EGSLFMQSIAARIVLALVLCLATRATAQSGPPPVPCKASPEAHKFDFWIGEWDVTPAGASTVVGHSVIQAIATGCGLLENWTASNGSDGKSINAFNPSTKQWQQYWVGSGGGVTEYRESTWRGDTLVFLARSTTAQGAAIQQRLSFSKLDGETVRQFG